MFLEEVSKYSKKTEFRFMDYASEEKTDGSFRLVFMSGATGGTVAFEQKQPKWRIIFLQIDFYIPKLIFEI